MSTKTQELYERRKRVVPTTLGIFTPTSAASAQGATIIDADGRELIDFAGGIGVLNAGHCPEPVVKAIQDQAAKLIHTCFPVSIYESYLDLAEKLATLFPHHAHDGDCTKVMMTNSGAEAVENAIKIARQATGRQAILCYLGAFHGRSMMAMTLTSKTALKLGCGPFAPEVYRLPFPAYNPRIHTASEAEFCQAHLDEIRKYFTTTVAAQHIAAIIIEPVQGEGGFYVVPKPYLQGLRQLCDETGILLIIDEVQSGFGRTGKWAAYEHYDIRPDISTWAKSMGSGMPIGCVIAKGSIIDSINPGTIGGTYLGNPVCCAAALATIQYMEHIDINALGVKIGSIIRKRFEEFHRKYPQHISDVRGLGAMLAFELSIGGDIAMPDSESCKKLIHFAAEQGLILLSAGLHSNVIRTLTPLVISEELLNRGLDIIEAGLKMLAG
ncbi:MAG: aminotransferase class III-fold pyridoxal phosphate-dependent enzyme [Bacteroidota bacterium]|nr:aminotransferase class III-fold pyridoxal phosphate-dependent enzyme [Candidatus Kapabacteria bacterium]MDW8220586.1 aminotransferase class III-fold pyridoxal phosphate-dependent enzyme [Bacteroidota bacterium]